MAILDRIRRIARANITQWLNLAETPESEVAAKITELEGAGVEAKNALASFAVAYKRMEKTVRDLEESRDGWQQRAQASLLAGDEDGARRALSEKLRADERRQQLLPVLESRRQTYDELKENLVGIHDQLNQARARLMDLRARKRAALAEQAMGRSLENMPGTGERLFERLEEDVLEQESRAEIDRDLRGVPATYAPDPQGDAVEAALAELKRQSSGGPA